MALTLVAGMILSSGAYARVVHQDNLHNISYKDLNVGITLYTGIWNGPTCAWKKAFAITNIVIGPFASTPWKLDNSMIPALGVGQQPTCGELRFVTQYGTEYNDKFKILVNAQTIIQGTDPDHRDVYMSDKK